MEKLWNGRFSKSTALMTERFNASIPFDYKLYPYDILGSYYHMEMLAKQGIVTSKECDAVQTELLTLYKEIENGQFEFLISQEDIHMNIESQLIERIGEAGKKLHTGRSRNDQVALDMKLYTKDAILLISDALTSLIETLNQTASEHLSTIMPGFTHLQQAQPITLGHHLLAYVEMFKRDTQRLFSAYEHMDEMPLGSGALASTSYPIDRSYVAEKLGFKRITANSLDAVSDRDYLIECLSTYSIIMMHLSRFCEEIILWNSQLFEFIELDDAYTTGSSIMPQKKNPDIHELIRGKTGRFYGNLMQLLTVMKSLPLAYNKDMQEDKELFIASSEQLLEILSIMGETIKTAKFNASNMYSATLKGYTEATDLADYLVKKGQSFRDSHFVIGQIIGYATSNHLLLTDLPLKTYQDFSDKFESDLFDVIKLENIVNSRTHIGGPAPSQNTQQIKANQLWLQKTNKDQSERHSPIGLLKSIINTL